MINNYWLKVLVTHILVVLIVSKSFFIILLFTWGGLPDWFYNAYMYIGNWPSLMSETFPYFYDRFGTKGLDMAGIFDIKSALVNILGWLPVGLLLGYLYKKWKARS